jgi:LEA14-like dessication related protein
MTDEETDVEVEEMDSNDEEESPRKPNNNNNIARTKRPFKLFIIFLIIIILAGTGIHYYLVYLAASSIEVSNVAVNDVKAKSIADYEVTFLITLNNPTSTTIEIEALTYDLYLEGDFIGSGKKNSFDIDPGSEQYSFKVDFNINDLSGSARTLFLQDSANLKIKCQVIVPIKLFGAIKVGSVTVSKEIVEPIGS